MKILMITDNLMKGGKERRMLEILRHFEHLDDIYVDLIILKDMIEYDEVHALKKTKLTILKRRIKKDPKIFSDLSKICRESKPDLIHSWGSMPSIYIFPVARKLKIPFINGMVVNAKCKIFSEDWTRSRITFPFSTAILANSHAGLNAYHVKPPKGHVIYNGFNFDRIKKLQSKDYVKKHFGIKTEYVVGMVGAFHPRKDYKTYLETADKITSKRKDICFVAAGGGDMLGEFRQSYTNNPLIVFTNRVDHVEDLIQIFDIGVLLTNPDKHLEGISNVILEMMAMKKPVIATTGGGTNEIVENNQTGLLIPAHDHHSFSQSVSKLIADENMRLKMGEAGYERVKKVFSIEQMISNILGLYKQVARLN